MNVEGGKGLAGLYSTDLVRATLSGHSILGIAFGAIIHLLCLTGTLLVFEHEFQRWEQPDAPRVARADDRAVANAVGEAVARFGSDARLYVPLPDAALPRLEVLRLTDEDETTLIADASGHLRGQQRSPWTEFLTGLHTELHLPHSWGRFVVGLAGVALLSSLISGVLSHPRILRDAFQLRLGGSRRLEQADIHNRIGVWALPFHVIVSLTGSLLGLSTLIVGVLALLMFNGDTRQVYALLSPPAHAVDARAAPLPDLVAMLATVRALSPGATPKSLTVQHPGRQDAQVVISAGRPRLVAAQDSFTFDASGRLVAAGHPPTQTLGSRILGSLGPLHFGWFDGLVVRVGYGLLGLGLCTLTSSGLRVWLARRRDRGRPAPLWERVWASIVWGQPVILALIALAPLVIPGVADGTLAVIWLDTTIAVTAGAALMQTHSDARIRLLLRTALGVLLLTVAVTHLLRWRMSGDAAATWVDAVLLAIAGCLLWRPTATLLAGSRAARPA